MRANKLLEECAVYLSLSDKDFERLMKKLEEIIENDKVSDGGPLTPELKQDANPPFTARLVRPCQHTQQRTSHGARQSVR